VVQIAREGRGAGVCFAVCAAAVSLCVCVCVPPQRRPGRRVLWALQVVMALLCVNVCVSERCSSGSVCPCVRHVGSRAVCVLPQLRRAYVSLCVRGALRGHGLMKPVCVYVYATAAGSGTGL
jgi:hypothetical protein